MKLAGKTNIGLQRTQNQDDFLMRQLDDETYVLLVCDGMGGANAGSVASKQAKKDIFSYIESHFKKDNEFDIEDMLCKAISFANTNIFVESKECEEKIGMGTTAVLAFIHNNKAIIAHVGDSRAYLINKEKIKCLTVDHSVVQTLVDEGRISEEQAKNHPQKNIITRAIGVSLEVSTDISVIELYDNDILVLCTDGLNGFIEDTKIFETIINNDFYKCPQLLIDMANSIGGSDNVTVVMAMFND